MQSTVLQISLQAARSCFSTPFFAIEFASWLDALGLSQAEEHEIVESLARYVTDEYQNKCQENVDTSDWPRRFALQTLQVSVE